MIPGYVASAIVPVLTRYDTDTGTGFGPDMVGIREEYLDTALPWFA